MVKTRPKNAGSKHCTSALCCFSPSYQMIHRFKSWIDSLRLFVNRCILNRWGYLGGSKSPPVGDARVELWPCRSIKSWPIAAPPWVYWGEILPSYKVLLPKMQFETWESFFLPGHRVVFICHSVTFSLRQNKSALLRRWPTGQVQGGVLAPP